MSLIEHNSLNNDIVDSNQLDGVLFDIKERPLVYYENGGPPVETDYKVILNADNNQALYIGKIYEPVLNSDIVNVVQEQEGLSLKRVRNYYGKRFELTYVLEDMKFMLGPEETHFSLNIINSYDGSCSLHVMGGLYVLVCSNGATIGLMTYQFKRKHTQKFGPNELKGFVQDSIEYICRNSDRVASKEWSNDGSLVKKQFDELTQIFPNRKDNKLHPNVLALDTEYSMMENRYPELKEWALFMAATNMTTRPNQYGLAPTYTKALDSIIGNVFFN